MNSEADASEKGLDKAIALVKTNDIRGARVALGISEDYTDDQLVEGLIACDTGLSLFRNQSHLEALEHLQRALPIVKASDDEEAKRMVEILCRFAEGLVALFSGKAHEAYELLNISADAIKRVSFSMPELKLASYSYRAVSLVALAKAHLSAADIPAAERAFGEMRNVHDELLSHLDPDEDEHALAFGEVYGTRIDLCFTFIMMLDLPSLDLGTWRKRLDLTGADVKSLGKFIDRMPQGHMQTLVSQYPSLHAVFEKLHSALEAATLKRKPLSKDDLKALVNVDTELFNMRQIVQKCGERAQGLIFIIDILRRLQRNILRLGRAATQDFGRFSGIIALAAFIVLILIAHFTVNPTGGLFGLYFSGALILALISGFGYGALKFRPLLKMFADAMLKQPRDG